MQENIKKEPGMLGALRKLSESTNSRVKKAAKGALWKMEGEQKHQKKLSEYMATSSIPVPSHMILPYLSGYGLLM